MVCNDDEADYSTALNAGSTYEWTVTGGTITAGAGTSQVTVLWGNPGTGTLAVTETSDDDCEGTSESLQVAIDDCTGIGEGADKQVSIYPNPASDNLHVTGLENATIRIYNLVGTEILTINNANGNYNVDISGISKGIYLVKVEQARGLAVFQLVKR